MKLYRLEIEAGRTEDNMVIYKLVDDQDNIVCHLGANIVEDSYDYVTGFNNLRIVTEKTRSEKYWG